MATQAEVAAHLFVDQAIVSRMLSKGVLPAAGRGQLDMDACRQAYIEHVRGIAAGRDSSRPGSLEAERARLASAQAEAMERKNAHERGDIVSRSAVDDAAISLVTISMARLERIGATVAGSDIKLRRRIEAAVHDAMRDLSNMTPESIMAATKGYCFEEPSDEE